MWCARYGAFKYIVYPKGASIQKQVTVHTLRHTYATHLREEDLDIVSIKELLGHAHIETTMVYLHVAQLGRKTAFSPLDRLYQNGKLCVRLLKSPM
ncbi:tyrosine-type recombinase/integrase [Chryseolinea sp. H1M3-3]|uniref:tyrosine-type recombinase/integrase n=1 Tax=Chryseolinea sp. H1M3-3 TaxID=3034144 RepID=UPI0023EAAB1D|nr:tyrosine-type recombinase/integrase [Chryseolinea sp. H1M3-3]